MHPDVLDVSPSRKHSAHRSLRLPPQSHWLDPATWLTPLLIVMATVFVLWGGSNQDLGVVDSSVGLAAGEPLGPLGRVCGLWDPELWPGRVGPSWLLSVLVEDGRDWPGTVLFPKALAAVAIGWLVARRLAATTGVRAGLLFGLCWYGSVGVIDHGGGTGLDFLSGLAILAAIDRLLQQGSDWVAGCWSALALLIGGWPSLVIVLMAVIVIGRKESTFSLKLLLPPITAFAGWSGWMLAEASPEALAAALAVPFTHKSSWFLPLTVMALGMPATPFALLGVSSTLRSRWTPSTRSTVAAWVQVAIGCLVAGTIVPGLASSAAVPALAGILVAVAATLDSAWMWSFQGRMRRCFLGLSLSLTIGAFLLILYGEAFCLVIASYYRVVGIAAFVTGFSALILAWYAARSADTRRAVVSLVVLIVTMKLVHWGVIVPEMTYRHGQGPWGRAIGQWLLPNWPLFTVHEWPRDLAFAIGRSVHQLNTPRHLAYQLAGGEARHVLLLESEFEHWPEDAPALTKVAEFSDAWGGRRILARTEGRLLTPSGAVFPPNRLARGANASIETKSHHQDHPRLDASGNALERDLARLR